MAESPNILTILTDQQTLGALGAAGNPWLRTPNLDALAAAGVRFEQSYCTSPVCGPARSSLFTSRMPHALGVNVNDQVIRPGIPGLGDLFRPAGYETLWLGKTHVRQSGPGAQGGLQAFDVPGVGSGRGHLGDDAIAAAAEQALRQPRERPLCLVASFVNPHDICYWIMEGGKQGLPDPPPLEDLPPLPPNQAADPGEPGFVAACRQRDHYGHEQLWTRDWPERRWREYLWAYYRLVEKADAAVGRVLNALRDTGLDRDTLVLFTSDHGEGVAAHRWVVKLMLWEEIVRVPFILSWPGHVPSGVTDAARLVSGLDALPTCCDYAGIPLREDFEGVSLKPFVEDPRRPGREFLVVELQPDTKRPEMKGRLLRTGSLAYLAFSEGANPELLFDLAVDPGQTRSLAADPAARPALDRCRVLLRDWCRRTSDDFAVPDGKTAGTSQPALPKAQATAR